jgi:hypothetical protein
MDPNLLADLKKQYAEGEAIRARALEIDAYDTAAMMTTKLTELARIIAELEHRKTP